MKSIIEEASSIFKAIEKAWERAGKPGNFSVKIFEDCQRSFFGLTKKQAKIGLFFDEMVNQEETSPSYAKEHRSSVNTANGEHHATPKYHEKRPRSPRNTHHETTTHQSAHVTTQEQTSETKVQRKKPAPRVPVPHQEGTTNLVKAIEVWLAAIVSKANLPVVPHTVTQRGNRLQVTFDRMIFDDPMKNTGLFRSLSYLLLGMVKNRYKREFRFLKVVLTTRDAHSHDTAAN
jgi:hypothetical protein